MELPATSRVILVTGDDESTIRERAEAVVRQVAGEDPDPFRLEVIAESDERDAAQALNDVLTALMSPSLLGGARTVWLKHFSGFAAEGKKRDSSGVAAGLRVLAERIEAGLPNDVTLVLDGPGVDRSKALFKACEKQGKVVLCMRPDARNARALAEQVTELIRAAAGRKGVDLPRDVAAYLAQVVGSDTARIDPELEKLICFCGGPDAPITMAAAREVCTVELEAHGWDVSDAVARGDVPGALRAVALILDRERDAQSAVRGLLVQIARTLRELLMVRVLAREAGLRSPRQLYTFLKNLDPKRRSAFVEQGLDIVRSHPYRVQRLGETAVRVTDEFLIKAHEIVTGAYRRCVFSGEGSIRSVLEQAIFEIARIHPRRKRRAGVGPVNTVRR